MTGTTLAFTGAEYLPQAKITPVQAAKFRRAKSTGDTSENFLGTLSEGPVQVERIVGEAKLGSRRDTQITRFARTGWWSAVFSNSQATSCSRLEPASAERVTRNKEGTERQSARSLNSPLGTTSCFSASSQVPPIHTVC
jgi:hypothetical protein